MIALSLGSLAFMALFMAALGIPHKALGYRRADALTALSYLGLVGLAFGLDPFPKVVGKNDLYVAIPAIAALLAYVGLKLEEKTQLLIVPLIVAPLLASVIAPALLMIALASDATDYRPSPPQHRHLLSSVARHLSHKPKPA